MIRLLRRAAVAVLALPIVLPAGPAHAERWSAPDASGNVEGWHYDPEPAPCGTMTDVDGSADANDDITRLTVRHEADEVWIAVAFRDLDRTLEQSLSLHVAVPEGRGWMVQVDRVKARKGRFQVWYFFAKEIPEPDPEELDECGGGLVSTVGRACRIRPLVDFATDRIRVAVPRRCLRDPEWVRVGARSYGWPTYDPAAGSYGGFHDEWGTPEEGASEWLPPFGPEVSVSSAATS